MASASASDLGARIPRPWGQRVRASGWGWGTKVIRYRGTGQEWGKPVMGTALPGVEPEQKWRPTCHMSKYSIYKSSRGTAKYNTFCPPTLTNTPA